MINNKILIIDDNRNRWKSIEHDFPQYVTTDDNIEKYFAFDKAGNYCQPKFELTEFNFVFIHHSQQGDSILPSNLLDLIKESLGLQLILFSGSIPIRFENKDTAHQYFRSISRGELSRKIKEFITTSILLGRWEIESLFFDFTKRLKRNLVLMLEEMEPGELFGTEEMREFLAITGIKEGTALYQTLIKLDQNSLIKKLEILTL